MTLTKNYKFAKFGPKSERCDNFYEIWDFEPMEHATYEHSTWNWWYRPKLSIRANLVPKLKCAPIFMKLKRRGVSTAKSALSEVAPAALLYSLSFMGNFLEILQVFNQNSFQYKKHKKHVRLTSYGDMIHGIRFLFWLQKNFNFSRTPRYKVLGE